MHGKFKSLEEYQLSLGNLQEVRSHFDDRARDPAIACHKEKKNGFNFITDPCYLLSAGGGLSCFDDINSY